MTLVLDEDQKLLADAARDFVATRSSLKRVRALRDDDIGFSRELWREMARLGWPGLPFPEELGGAGLGWRYLMVVLEELGAGLAPEPLVSTVLLGGSAFLYGDPDLRREHLPRIAAGDELVAVAYQEAGTRYALDRATTRFAAGTIVGEKVQVMGGSSADWLIVSAHGPGGVGLYVVDATRVRRTRQHRIDGRDAAIVRLDGVPATPLGGPGLLARVIDVATIGLCAEMLGAMGAAFAMTLAYLKTRTQFGVPIGSFQALQHRAARLYIDLELCRSATMHAHAVLDAGGDVARAASLAKAKLSDAFLRVAEEAIQLHGGIGMTEEHDLGLYLKRARVAEITFGDAAHHRARWAELSGY
ncbi:MAG TPA: acyl-CoA dehydrogenase family protein [Haliangiales bacterium]|nr:acyl-CoA dehydrogenase family protein [Haliangiales bacterium]